MIRNGWHLLFAVLAMIVVALTLLHSVGVTPNFASYLLNFQIYAFSIATVLGIHLLIVLWKARPEHPIGFTVGLVRTHRHRALWALPLMLAASLFMPTFSAMKSAIPLFNEYTWDQAFVGLDALIHGQDPWLWMQPVLGFPIITALLAVIYHLWLLLIYVGSVYFAFYVSDKTLVLRYFLSFFLIWCILGVVLATSLASVGPVFLEPIVGNDRFLAQVRYLAEANETVPIMVLPVQEALLAGYESGNHGLGGGITAMPSMHVALACLFWLAIRRVSKPLNHFFLAFLALILIGSVHLAYHYAIDGYLSAILTVVIWKLSALVVTDTPGFITDLK